MTERRHTVASFSAGSVLSCNFTAFNPAEASTPLPKIPENFVRNLLPRSKKAVIESRKEIQAKKGFKKRKQSQGLRRVGTPDVFTKRILRTRRPLKTIASNDESSSVRSVTMISQTNETEKPNIVQSDHADEVKPLEPSSIVHSTNEHITVLTKSSVTDSRAKSGLGSVIIDINELLGESLCESDNELPESHPNDIDVQPMASSDGSVQVILTPRCLQYESCVITMDPSIVQTLEDENCTKPLELSSIVHSPSEPITKSDLGCGTININELLDESSFESETDEFPTLDAIDSVKEPASLAETQEQQVTFNQPNSSDEGVCVMKKPTNLPNAKFNKLIQKKILKGKSSLLPDNIKYDPKDRGCQRDLRVRRYIHPWWIHNGSADRIGIEFGVIDLHSTQRENEYSQLQRKSGLSKRDLRLSHKPVGIELSPSLKIDKLEKLKLLKNEGKAFPEQYGSVWYDSTWMKK